MQSTEYDQAPPQLRIFLDSDYGSAEVIRLSGLSGTGVFRLRSGTASVIVKAEASPNEAWFYSAVAPLLRPAGVETPALMFQTTSASGRAWLVLEDIPAALPRERWLADGQLLHLLRILHGTLPPPISDSATAFTPCWTDAMTDRAVKWLPGEKHSWAAGRLRELQEVCQPLFRPLGSICGDANPNNWGLRANGGLVLFDWERFGWGTAALDLATTIPGLGSTDSFARVAARYLDTPSPDLARQIATAKAWTAAEFLSDAAGQTVQGEQIGAWLGSHLGEWLRSEL